MNRELGPRTLANATSRLRSYSGANWYRAPEAECAGIFNALQFGAAGGAEGD